MHHVSGSIAGLLPPVLIIKMSHGSVWKAPHKNEKEHHLSACLLFQTIEHWYWGQSFLPTSDRLPLLLIWCNSTQWSRRRLMVCLFLSSLLACCLRIWCYIVMSAPYFPSSEILAGSQWNRFSDRCFSIAKPLLSSSSHILKNISQRQPWRCLLLRSPFLLTSSLRVRRSPVVFSFMC